MQIPTYERNQPVDLSGPTPVSTPQSSGLSSIGEGAIRAGALLKENADKESAIAGRNAFADFQLQQNRDFEEAAKAAPADPKGFSSLFMEQYDKSMNEQLSKIPEGPGRDAFLLQAKTFRNHLDVTARGFEANRRADFKEAEGNKFGDTLSANVLHDPGSFSDSLQQIDEYAVNLKGFMAPDAIQKWRDKKKFDLAATHLSVIGNENPQAGIDAINSGMYDGLIPSDKLAGELASLKNKSEQVNSWESREAKKDANKLIMGIRNTGTATTDERFNPKNIVARLGGDANAQKVNADLLDQGMTLAFADWLDRQNYTGQSQRDRDAYFKARRMELLNYDGPVDVDAMREQIEASEKASDQDYKAMSENPKDYFGSTDPVTNASSIQAMESLGKPEGPALFSSYASHLINAQLSAGKRRDEILLLSPDEAVNTVKDIESKAVNSEDALNRMRDYKTHYGEYFDDVMRQLKSLPETTRLKPEFGLVMDRLDQPYINRLVNILRTDRKDIEARFPNDKAKNAVEDGLRSDPAVKQWLASNPDGAASDIEAMTQYAMYMETHGYSGRGIKLAAQDIIGSYYSFKSEPGGGTVAIRRLTGRTDQQIANIKDSLDNLKVTIANQPLDKFNRAQVELLAPGAANDEERKNIIHDLIMDGGRWQNEGSDSAVLYVDDPKNGATQKLISFTQDKGPMPLELLPYKVDFRGIENMSAPANIEKMDWRYKDVGNPLFTLGPPFRNSSWAHVSGSDPWPVMVESAKRTMGAVKTWYNNLKRGR